MIRYGIAVDRIGMEPREDGAWVLWEDVRRLILDLESGLCTNCHEKKGTVGGLLCLECRRKACFRVTSKPE